MSAFDPHGALQKVPFVQYLSGAELFSFARTLERVTVAEGALLLPPPTVALLMPMLPLHPTLCTSPC